jgi:quercetin dioxygenase-like cupin family protein
MKIDRSGSQPSAKGPSDWFTGRGWVQRENAPVEEVRPGDVVLFEPGEKHWHGASATTAMQHIAINESLNGKAVDWLEKVSDEQYAAGSGKQ